MTIDEFLKKASSQPVVIEPRTVNVWGPALKESIAQRKPTMTVAEISAHPDQRKEVRTYRRGHVLGPGLPYDAIES